MESELKKIISEVFNYSVDEIEHDLEFSSIPAWDSITHLSFISAVENEFDIELSGDEIVKVTSYSRTIKVLSSHGLT